LKYGAARLLPLARAIAEHLARAAGPGEQADALAQLATTVNNAVAGADVTAGPGALHAVLARALGTGARVVTIIADALAALSVPLPWRYHYSPRADAPDLAERIGFAELIGPGGPLIAESNRIGLTLMAPETFYPWHAHPAVELYVVISGTARWMTATSSRELPPGACLRHFSNEPHAMRTQRDPLLALYAWSGDIASPATYL
jgi:mannose-6-phosphate isomerase-like protein (cupin superfamily)